MTSGKAAGVKLLRIAESSVPECHGYPSKTYQWTGPPLLDACNVETAHGHLLALTEDGSLYLIDLQVPTATHLCTVNLPEIPLGDAENFFGTPRHRLHASPDGAHAAVVVDRGQTGFVIETQSGNVTMRLNGGDYCQETVPFSACFLRLNGRDVFVHRTSWNRLEASDPATAQTLTEREIAPYESPGERPAHYLDYFHGQLLPSPGGELILDDGWVWHPVSIPRVWSVTAWLTGNPWEIEDGPTVVDLEARDDWTQPACWLDERRVAIWKPTDVHDETLEEITRGNGVQIFEVTATKSATASWWPLTEVEAVSALFSDGTRLYVAGNGRTAVFDIESRKLVTDYPNFVAQLFDRSRNTLLAFESNSIHVVPTQR